MPKQLIKSEDTDNRDKIETYLHVKNITFSKYASSDGDEYYYFVNTIDPLEIDDVEYELLPVRTNMNLELAADEDNPMMQPEPDIPDIYDDYDYEPDNNDKCWIAVSIGMAILGIVVLWTVFA